MESVPVSEEVEFVVGTCKALKASGLEPFYSGEANYTNRRDRDNGEIVCE